jgi:sporulation protein YlmC with PRC-barrel domain
MRINYEQTLRGRPVVDASGRVIGDVEQLLLETDPLAVAGLVIKLRSEAAEALGAHRSVFHAAHLDVPREAIQGLGDTVVLRVEAAALLTRAPEVPR